MITFSLIIFSTEKGVNSLYRLWVVSAIIYVGIGIGELATGMHLGEPAVHELLGYNYPRAVFFHHNTFAVFLVLSFPFLYVLVRYSKNILAKGLGLVAMLLTFYFIVFGDVIGAMIGISMGICLIPILVGWRAKVRFMVVGLVITMALTLSSYAFQRANDSSILDLVQGIPQRISALSDPYSVYSQLSPLSSRQSLIKDGLRFLEDSHYLGVGAGGFELYMAGGAGYYTTTSD